MRVLWEIFTLMVGIGILFALAKGFPGFGRVLFFFIANPFGLVLTIGLIVLVVFVRRRKPQSPPDLP